MEDLVNKNYKEKYDKVLEWARNLYNSKHADLNLRITLEDVFPELKESEDERIRKEILNVFKQLDEGTTICGRNYDYAKWIDWLEKQEGCTHIRKELFEHLKQSWYKEGFADGKYSSPSFEYNGHTWGMCARDNGVDILLDKQLFTHLEKQGEQKPTDKVEPKFKVGDWVIYECGEDLATLQIKDIVHGTYEFTDNSTLNVVDGNTLRLWTIQDAKDGDVLVTPLPKEYESGEQIFIFKEINHRDYVSNCIEYYCRVCQGFFYENEIGFMGTTDGIFHPATKEQRDLLFQKMKEAGHEWDAEKKELKEIEQKHAWSEEDENGLGDALWAIQQARSIAKNENEMGCLWYAERWLNSLKDMVKPQPKCVWSEEDERTIDEAISLINMLASGYGEKVTEPITFNGVKMINNIKERLRNLHQKPNHWKPSDEQIKALNYVVNLMASSESPTENDYYYNVLKDMRTQLKKLKE